MAIKVTIPELLSISEAARILNVSRQTIYTWIDEGQLHYLDLGKRRYLFVAEVNWLKAERKK